jgi:hypothetical protein
MSRVAFTNNTALRGGGGAVYLGSPLAPQQLVCNASAAAVFSAASAVAGGLAVNRGAMRLESTDVDSRVNAAAAAAAIASRQGRSVSVGDVVVAAAPPAAAAPAPRTGPEVDEVTTSTGSYNPNATPADDATADGGSGPDPGTSTTVSFGDQVASANFDGSLLVNGAAGRAASPAPRGEGGSHNAQAQPSVTPESGKLRNSSSSSSSSVGGGGSSTSSGSSGSGQGSSKLLETGAGGVHSSIASSAAPAAGSAAYDAADDVTVATTTFVPGGDWSDEDMTSSTVTFDAADLPAGSYLESGRLPAGAAFETAAAPAGGLIFESAPVAAPAAFGAAAELPGLAAASGGAGAASGSPTASSRASHSSGGANSSSSSSSSSSAGAAAPLHAQGRTLKFAAGAPNARVSWHRPSSGAGFAIPVAGPPLVRLDAGAAAALKAAGVTDHELKVLVKGGGMEPALFAALVAPKLWATPPPVQHGVAKHARALARPAGGARAAKQGAPVDEAAAAGSGVGARGSSHQAALAPRLASPPRPRTAPAVQSPLPGAAGVRSATVAALLQAQQELMERGAPADVALLMAAPELGSFLRPAATGPAPLGPTATPNASRRRRRRARILLATADAPGALAADGSLQLGACGTFDGNSARGEGSYGPALASFPAGVRVQYGEMEAAPGEPMRVRAFVIDAFGHVVASGPSAFMRVHASLEPPGANKPAAAASAGSGRRRLMQAAAVAKPANATAARPGANTTLGGNATAMAPAASPVGAPPGLLLAAGERAAYASAAAEDGGEVLTEGDVRLEGTTQAAVVGGVSTLQSLRLIAPVNDTVRVWLAADGAHARAAAAPLLVRLRTCASGAVLTPKDGCITCGAGLYAFDPKGSSCSACPTGAWCNGTVVAPLAGAWHSSPRSAQVHWCPNPVACTRAPGAQQQLIDEQRAGFATVSSVSADEEAVAAYGRLMCAPGYKGRVCGECSEVNGMRFGKVGRLLGGKAFDGVGVGL